MDFIDVVVLSAVQGLTEFLPVSSSGHLVVIRMLFGISDSHGNAFDAFLHLGTLAAVMIYFRRLWWELVHAFVVRTRETESQRRLVMRLIVGTLPAALAGFVWRDFFEASFRSPQSIAVSFIITAFVLLGADVRLHKRQSIYDLSLRDAFVIGIAQLIALVPGISRSGMTMAAGLVRGLSRRDAATFSFLLSAPIIAGAGFSSLWSLLAIDAFSYNTLFVGFTSSLLAGLFAIDVLLKLIARTSFAPFVLYLFVLAGAVWYFG